jgi:hypothetical protein
LRSHQQKLAALPAFPLAMLGILRAGALQVNVNPLLRHASLVLAGNSD